MMSAADRALAAADMTGQNADGGMLLSLRGIRIVLGERTLLEGLDLDIPTCGVTTLLGPCGAGKSTLLSVLCGAPTPARRAPRTGTARYGGRSLRPTRRPALVAQFAARPLNDHEIATAHAVLSRDGIDAWDWPKPVTDRLLAIGSVLVRDPEMICIDEPTAGLDDYESAPILSLIEQEGKRRAILLVTHNKEHARFASDWVLLIAGGRVIEHGPSEAFFDGPSTEEGRQFLRFGTSGLPAPGTPRHLLAPEFRGLPEDEGDGQKSAVPADQGPPGFAWIIDGMLASMRRPGAVRPLEADLEALCRVGVTAVISFEPEPEPVIEQMVAAGLAPFWIPIGQDDVPTPEIGHFYCLEVARLLSDGQVVAIHSGSEQDVGMMMLAAQLVCRGFTAGEALNRIRNRTRVMLSSILQEQFVWDLELFLDMVTSGSQVLENARSVAVRGGV